MATYTDLMSLFDDMGSAINTKIGTSSRYYPNEMPDAIRAIPTGGGAAANNSALTVTPGSTSQTFSASGAYTGYNPVTVEAIPNSYIVPSGTYTVTDSGVFNITNYSQLSVPQVGLEPNDIKFSIISSSGYVHADISAHSAGWYNIGNIFGNYYRLPSTSVSHITPLSTSQVAVPQYKWTLNEVIVDAIPATYVIPEGTLEITANGSYNVTNYASVSVAIPVGATINNYTPNAVTPTETVQTIDIPSGYTGLGQVTVNAISSNYVGTNITRRNSITLTSNTGNVLASAGYYSAAASITLPTTAGTTIYPSTVSQVAVPQYNWTTGSVIVAALSANSAISTTLNSTTTSVTIPAGYYAEAGIVSHTTVAIPGPTFSFNSTTRVITASGNWTRGFTTNNSYTNTYTVATGTVVPSSTITGTSATLTVGTNTLTFSKTISVTPNVTTAGWISAGTASNVVVSLTAAVSTRTSNSLTAAGSTVTVPAGYYATQATKNVASATHPSPTISFNSTTGVITANHTQTAGYVAAGTTSSTMSLTTKAASTITPTTSSQTAVAANTFVTGLITVGPIPSSYHQLNNTTTATSADIVAGETAYNSNGQLITGELQAITYYTGSTVPNSSLGSDGDIYLQG